MNEEDPNTAHWRRKLDAFMHDNPAKPLDIRGHEARAEQHKLSDRIQPDEAFEKTADFKAAAADRLPFPRARALTARYEELQNLFHHPLAGGAVYRSGGKLTADRVDEITQGARPHLDEGDERAQFITRWRFWRLWSQEQQSGDPESRRAIAYLPADTRIPDHTIWNHLGLTSAFQGCFDASDDERPSLLLFSIGPVQPLIAAARRIGDLWSGSYLLSYLASTALGEIARTFGPDHIVFPSAWGQPLIDLQLRDIYQNARITERGGDSLWDQIWSDDPDSRRRFLLPSLPNRCLALLPSSKAPEFAGHLENTVREKLVEIGRSVDAYLEHKLPKDGSGVSFHPERIEPQLRASLEVHWQTLQLPRSLEEARSLDERFLPNAKNGAPHPARQSLDRLEWMWRSIPSTDHTSYGINTAEGTAWPLAYATLAWAHDAVKNTRSFNAWSAQSSWNYGVSENKDNLTGKEELVFAVDGEERARELGGKIARSQAAFRDNERLGALSLVKRLWHLAYLSDRYGFEPEEFRMPDTHQLSNHRPFATEKADEGTEEAADYIAVIALDGDEMGKWIAGEKTPRLDEQLTQQVEDYFNKNLPDSADAGQISAKDFLASPRPLNPSFHLQFSEALANFGLHTAGRIVEAYNGRLIYAGDDDVLALVPADDALNCARSLRSAFRGEGAALGELHGVWIERKSSTRPNRDDDARLFDTTSSQAGFLRLHKDLERYGDHVAGDLLVPGPAADVSAGIAVGHAKSPLQDLVRSAQGAEKRAKTRYGRAAFALSIFKRSGEQVHWGAKWSARRSSNTEENWTETPSPALQLLNEIYNALRQPEGAESLESRFPHKFTALLEPYLGGAPLPGGHDGQAPPGGDPAFDANAESILQKEFEHCLERGGCSAPFTARLLDYFNAYLQAMSTPDDDGPGLSLHERMADAYALFQAVAWLNKNARSDESETTDLEPATTHA